MKVRNLVKIISILSLTASFCGFSQDVSYRGNSAANFLKVNVTAKSVGMAEADITNHEDASCMFYNIGGISRIQGPSASFSYVQWLVETGLGHCAVTFPLEYGTIGFDVDYFTSGDIQETTLQKQEGTGKVITANDVAIGLAFAKNLTDRFSVGLKVKYIQENLASVSASAIGFDIGSIFETSFLNNMKLGISLSNFGSSLEFSGNDLIVSHVVPNSPTNKEIPSILQTNEWSLPMFYKIGVATNVFEDENVRMLVAYSLMDSRDYSIRHNIGTEVEIMKMFRLRGGYRFNYDETTFSAGAGIKIKASTMGDLYFDYAYTDFGVLQGVNQLSLSLNF